MKVMLISDHETGGAGLVASQTRDILNSNGVEAISLFGSNYYKFTVFGYLGNSSASKLIYNNLIDFKPDVIHIHNIDNILSPLILKSLEKFKVNHNPSVKIVMTIHDYHIMSAANSLTHYRGSEVFRFDGIPNFYELITKRLDRRGYMFGIPRLLQWYFYYKLFNFISVVDEFICPSFFIKELASVRLDESCLHLVRNPCSYKVTTNESNENKNSIIITFIGRVTKEKGIVSFCQELSNISNESNLPIIVNVIGKGNLENELMKIIGESSNNLKINHLGYQGKEVISDCLKSSHYTLLPALCYENAPLSLVEGMIAGCKIITMSYGGLKEIALNQSGSILLDDLSLNSISWMLKKINKEFLTTPVHEDSIKIDDYSESEYLNKLLTVYNK